MRCRWLCQKGTICLAGVIFDPLAEEFYVGGAGGGRVLQWRAALNKQGSSGGRGAGGREPAAASGAGVAGLDGYGAVIQVSQAVRRSGSAALNLAYVAHGRLDAFWATKIQPWDVAAGVLLVREAGGIVTGRDGAEFNLWQPHFASAAGPELHGDLLRTLGTGGV